jgi:hypothetical protein
MRSSVASEGASWNDSPTNDQEAEGQMQQETTQGYALIKAKLRIPAPEGDDQRRIRHGACTLAKGAIICHTDLSPVEAARPLKTGSPTHRLKVGMV